MFDGLQAAGHDVHLVITCIEADAYSNVGSGQGVKITVLRPLKRMLEQARKIADAMRKENGVAEAVRWIGQRVEDGAAAAKELQTVE